MPGDVWTAFQFDSAVSWFGIYIENKLNEIDYDSKPPRHKHTLKELLSDARPTPPTQLKGKGINPGLSRIRRVKRDGTTS